MILKRFYENRLAHASYLVGCAATGEAVVIDPNRDFDQYLDAASAEGLTITAITETHIHADFLSGSRELAQLTGATLYLSDEGDAEWKYAFADNVKLVKDGDEFWIGNLKVEVMHTPGHTPEHISFLVTDTPAGSTVQSAFTGDFVFVGDVGRPDLLEKAAGYEGTMEAGARRLFRTIQRFKALPDHLLVWPAHGAGSACGKSLGGVPVSTLGYEKATNWAFKIATEEEFVREVLSGQPEPPVYFAQMKVRNKIGPAILGGERVPPHLGDARIADIMKAGAPIVDLRPSTEFGAGFIPGTLNIPMGKSLTNWAGWLLPYDTPFYFIASTHEEAAEAAAALRMIGLDDAAGWFTPTVLDAWVAAGGSLGEIEQIDADECARRGGTSRVIDVRGLTEWEEGRMPFSERRYLGTLRKNLDGLSREEPIVLHCAGGGRSAIAASVLAAEGFGKVANVLGGFGEYARRGHPTVSG